MLSSSSCEKVQKFFKYRGYVYVSHLGFKNWIRWRCQHFKTKQCKGMLTTGWNFENDPRKCFPHNHEPDYETSSDEENGEEITTADEMWQAESKMASEEIIRQLKCGPRVILNDIKDQKPNSHTHKNKHKHNMISTERTHRHINIVDSRRQSVNFPLISEHTTKKVKERRQTCSNSYPSSSLNENDVERKMYMMFTENTSNKEKKRDKLKKAKTPEEIRALLVNLFEDSLDDIPVTKKCSKHSLPVSIKISSPMWTVKRKTEMCDNEVPDKKVQKRAKRQECKFAQVFTEFVPLCSATSFETDYEEGCADEVIEEECYTKERALVNKSPIIKRDITLRVNTILSKEVKEELIDLTNDEDYYCCDSEVSEMNVEDFKTKIEKTETKDLCKLAVDMPSLSPTSESEQSAVVEQQIAYPTIKEALAKLTSTVNETSIQPQIQREPTRPTYQTIYAKISVPPIQQSVTVQEPPKTVVSNRINIQSEHRYIPNTVQQQSAPIVPNTMQQQSAPIVPNTIQQQSAPIVPNTIQQQSAPIVPNTMQQQSVPIAPSNINIAHQSVVSLSSLIMPPNITMTAPQVRSQNAVNKSVVSSQNAINTTTTTVAQNLSTQSTMQIMQSRFGSPLVPHLTPVVRPPPVHNRVLPPAYPVIRINTISEDGLVELICSHLSVFDTWHDSAEQYHKRMTSFLVQPDLVSQTILFKKYSDGMIAYFSTKLLKSLNTVHIENIRFNIIFTKIVQKMASQKPNVTYNYMLSRQLTNLYVLVKHVENPDMYIYWLKWFIAGVNRNYQAFQDRFKMHEQTRCGLPSVHHQQQQQAKERPLQRREPVKACRFSNEQIMRFEEQVNFYVNVQKWLETQEKKARNNDKSIPNNVSTSVKMNSNTTNDTSKHSTASAITTQQQPKVPPEQQKIASAARRSSTCSNQTQLQTQTTIANSDSSGTEEVEAIEIIDLTWVDDNDNEEIYEMIENKAFLIKTEDEVEALVENREAVSPADSGLGSPRGQGDSYKCFCGNDARFVCRCKSHMYCSKECQIHDWSYHQPMCEKMSS